MICDEVYYGLVYPGFEYHSFGNLTHDVPMLVRLYLNPNYLLVLKFFVEAVQYSWMEIGLDHCLQQTRIS
jgi:hypothetical protein